MAQVVISGDHYDVPSPINVDHVVLFADLTQSDAYLRYNGTESGFEWRDYDNTVLQSGAGAEVFYPESDHGYILYTPDTAITFYVIDYKLYKPTFISLDATPECERTQLALNGSIPDLVYKDRYLMTHRLNREAVVRYVTLSWAGVEEGWTDSVAYETIELKPQMEVGSPLRDTYFTLCADQYASLLGLEPDSIRTDEMTAIAVACHLTSVTTMRGESMENEPGRPTEEQQLTGSAPIEINFMANANKPTATFYRWEIYRGSELIATRTDEDTRYTFMDKDTYKVKLWVSNEYCTTDSSEVDVSIDASLLLVPNVFTPNGDGINDEFRVIYTSLAEFECWIYNRWGKLVFHWTDPAKGWDGTINGRPAAAGAYYYVIRARGTDAEAGASYHKATIRHPMSQGVYQLSGDINLVR